MKSGPLSSKNRSRAMAAATAVAVCTLVGAPVAGFGVGIAGASSSHGHGSTSAGTSTSAPGHRSTRGAPSGGASAGSAGTASGGTSGGTSSSSSSSSTQSRQSEGSQSTSGQGSHSEGSHAQSTHAQSTHAQSTHGQTNAHTASTPESAPKSASAGGSAPPGNNGTIKIDETPVTDGPGMSANHPRVSCSFVLAFFGFDTGTRTATVSFTAQPPSGSFTPVNPLEGPTATTFFVPARTSGNQLDATYTYELTVSGLKAKKQGYHIRVTVDVSGSIGADQKSKVFWYEPCTGPATTTATASSVATQESDVAPTSVADVHWNRSITAASTASSAQRILTEALSVTSLSATSTAPVRPEALAATVSSTSSAAVPKGAPGTGGTPPTAGEPWLFGAGGGTALLGAVLGLGVLRRRRRAALGS